MTEPGSAAEGGATVSVVVPAHNEGRTVARLLTALVHGAEADLDVVVVCNGCTDDTAAIAAGFGLSVRVVEVPEPSKAHALVVGDGHSDVFPRAYVDADVVIDAASILRLRAALVDGVLAAGPRRELLWEGVSRTVRWYYDVWQRLPQVQDGLFGRGVVMVSEEGWGRLRSLPPMMSDDLAMSEAFADSERVVVHAASVQIRPPRTLRDLLRRRVRVVTGNAQADGAGIRHAASRTSVASLLRAAAPDPRAIAKTPVFLGVALAAKVLSRRAVRRGDYRTWLRDESSRV